MIEFILALIMALGIGSVDPAVVIKDLPHGINGRTYCEVQDGVPRCLVELDAERMTATGLVRTRIGQVERITEAQSTVIHELCHVKVYMKHLDGVRGHGRNWRNCMRRQGLAI